MERDIYFFCATLNPFRMKLLGCLGLLLFGGILVIAVFLRSLYDFALTALGLKPSSSQSAGQQGQTPHHHSSRRDTSSARGAAANGHTGQQKEKIFEKSDNEYVDFVDLP